MTIHGICPGMTMDEVQAVLGPPESPNLPSRAMVIHPNRPKTWLVHRDTDDWYLPLSVEFVPPGVVTVIDAHCCLELEGEVIARSGQSRSAIQRHLGEAEREEEIAQILLDSYFQGRIQLTVQYSKDRFSERWKALGFGLSYASAED